MKTIQFTVDLRSFFLGALTLIGILVLANFTPTKSAQPDPDNAENRRYQVATSERESIILDTRTGQFIVLPSYLGQPRYIKNSFSEIQARVK